MMELLTDLFVSELIGKFIVDRSGHKLGKVRDVWEDPESTFPVVWGLIIRHDGELKVIPWQDIYMLSRRVVALRVITSDVHFKKVSKKQFYTSGILDRQIVDMNGAKLVRVNDIKLVGDSNGVHIVLSKMHPADLAEIMESIGHKERLDLLGRLNSKTAADRLTRMRNEVGNKQENVFLKPS